MRSTLFHTVLFQPCLSLTGFVLLVSSALYAQPKLSVERTNALIGDQLKLTIQVDVPQGTDWINQDVVPGDTLSSLEVITSGDVQQSAGNTSVQFLKQWTIAVFDTGLVRIPSIPVVLRSTGGTDTQYTNDIPLMIAGVVDSSGLAPIKPIIREPVEFSDYLPYIIGAVVVGILAILFWIFRRRKSKPAPVVVVRDEKTADIIALEKLDALERERLWQQGMVKEYHSRMNYVVREYLQARYGIPALESTSTEIANHLGDLDIPADLQRQFKEVMEVEDLIKFAKAEPPVTIHAQYLDFARSVIQQTKPVSSPAASSNG